MSLSDNTASFVGIILVCTKGIAVLTHKDNQDVVQWN